MENLSKMTDWMRKQIIEMAYHAGKNGAHLASALSCVEIMAALYGHVMNVTPDNILTPSHDVFIPSKAHCVLSYYTALAYCGFLSSDDLNTFEDNLSILPGHPICNLEKGIEFSGGSLGMGFSQGVGMALGMKQHNLSQRVFILLGDGECDEGANWEAAQAAAHYNLNNIVVIVDANKLQYDGSTNDIMSLRNLSDKFKSFGFYTKETDGNDISKLLSTFEDVFSSQDNKPAAIIANTVKGKGISFMENKKQWHHAVLTKELYEAAMQELGGAYGI